MSVPAPYDRQSPAITCVTSAYFREFVRVEIAGVEISYVLHSLPAWKTDHSPIPCDQSLPLQGLQHAIDMNRGQAGCIGELLLRNRQLIGAIAA